MNRFALVARMYRVGSWLLIALLVFQSAAHLILTVLFYAGVHDQGYGFFLNARWPAWLITVLDVGAATALWWAYRRGRDRPMMGVSLTAGACAYIVGRMAWTIVVPVVAAIVFVGSIMRQRNVVAVRDAGARTADRR